MVSRLAPLATTTGPSAALVFTSSCFVIVCRFLARAMLLYMFPVYTFYPLIHNQLVARTVVLFNELIFGVLCGHDNNIIIVVLCMFPQLSQALSRL